MPENEEIEVTAAPEAPTVDVKAIESEGRASIAAMMRGEPIAEPVAEDAPTPADEAVTLAEAPKAIEAVETPAVVDTPSVDDLDVPAPDADFLDDKMSALMGLVHAIGGDKAVDEVQEHLKEQIVIMGGIDKAIETLSARKDAITKEQSDTRERESAARIDAQAAAKANAPIHKQLREQGYDPEANPEEYNAAFAELARTDQYYATNLQAHKAIARDAYRERLSAVTSRAAEFPYADPSRVEEFVNNPHATPEMVRGVQERSHAHTANAVSAVTRERDEAKAKLAEFEASLADKLATARTQGAAAAAAQLGKVQKGPNIEGVGDSSVPGTRDPIKQAYSFDEAFAGIR